MRKIIICLVGLMCLCGCFSKGTPEERAGKAVVQYYQYLLEGNCEAFVDATWHQDTIPASYREQLIANARMFLDNQKKAHGGIASVELRAVGCDTAKHVGEALLQLNFADSVSEQVVVPLVYKNDLWYLR